MVCVIKMLRPGSNIRQIGSEPLLSVHGPSWGAMAASMAARPRFVQCSAPSRCVLVLVKECHVGRAVVHQSCKHGSMASTWFTGRGAVSQGLLGQWPASQCQQHDVGRHCALQHWYGVMGTSFLRNRSSWQDLSSKQPAGLIMPSHMLLLFAEQQWLSSDNLPCRGDKTRYTARCAHARFVAGSQCMCQSSNAFMAS